MSRIPAREIYLWLFQDARDSSTLNKWCVTVYQQPDRQILVQDFFPERWKALARAQDFIRLLNQRKKKEEEALNSNDDDF